jgi:hypothetical protein
VVIHPPLAAPYDFVGAYAGCNELPEVAMDRRHIFIMHEVLKTWPFESALEIGSFNGASSTAFVEAINSGEGLGQSGIATFCDVSVSASLMDVAGNCRDLSRVRVTPQPSWAVLDSALPFDFVLVDAAHDIDSVSIEVRKLLARRPLCVMAHDTSATDAGYSRCEGAAMLKRTFMGLRGYRSIEDNVKREGERTERGLFLATTDMELYRRTANVFERYGE